MNVHCIFLLPARVRGLLHKSSFNFFLTVSFVFLWTSLIYLFTEGRQRTRRAIFVRFQKRVFSHQSVSALVSFPCTLLLLCSFHNLIPQLPSLVLIKSS